jgi:putative FmdB family regulatory protein
MERRVRRSGGVAHIGRVDRARRRWLGETVDMPRYEFRCRTCDDRFDVVRPMSQSSAPAPCPDGHADTVRVLSVFATPGGAPGRDPMPVAAGGGGGCCGGSCGCG